nr:hypothetical protein StreXyl84_11500 [Streptomyces sp. Xyl84]
MPPPSSAAIADWEASQWVEDTIPKVPWRVGRVVKRMSDLTSVSWASGPGGAAVGFPVCPRCSPHARPGTPVEGTGLAGPGYPAPWFRPVPRESYAQVSTVR